LKDEPKPSFNQVPLLVSHTLTSDSQSISISSEFLKENFYLANLSTIEVMTTTQMMMMMMMTKITLITVSLGSFTLAKVSVLHT